MKMLKTIITVIVLSATISCSTKVKTILSNIEKYDGKEVRIKGKAEGSTNIMLTKFFFIDDESGKKIKVITKNALPEDGKIIKVKGIVDQRFKIGEFQWVVIKESKKE